MDGGAWWAAVHGVAKSWTWLSDFTFTFHFHALEKEMATQCSCLENPRDRGAWWASVSGVAQSQTRLKRLSSSSSSCSLFIINSQVTVTKWKLCFLPGWCKVWKIKGIRFKKVMILSWNTNSRYKKENWLSFSQFTVSLLSVKMHWLQGEETRPPSFNQKGTDFPAIMSLEIVQGQHNDPKRF